MSGLGAELARARRMWPSVLTPKLYVWLVAQLFGVLAILVASFLSEAGPSHVIKLALIIPGMLLVAFMSGQVLSGMRETGELELASASHRPARVILRRLAPVIVLASAQLGALGLVLAALIGPLELIAGMLFSVGPMLFALSASLYWNLRLKSASNSLAATFATLLPACVWLLRAHMLSETGNRDVGLISIVGSFLRCDLGLTLAAVGLAALTRRRSQSLGESFDAAL